MMTLDIVRHHDPIARVIPLGLTRAAWRLVSLATGTRVVLENAHNLPTAPALLATNSTHKYDPVPIRAGIMAQGMDIVPVSKGKNWHEPLAAFACTQLGALPIVSRGYLITSDFIALHGRRPDEREYRTLRNHIDQARPLPDEGMWRRTEETAREILGWSFDPRQQTYRDAVLGAYHEFQRHLIRLGRQVIRSGRHIHMYPQGTVSTRLSKGRVGAVQLAFALDIPIVPIAVSGVAEVYKGAGDVLPSGGDITLRCGEPFRPGLVLPADFRPFHPEDERQHKATLQAATDDLMERINGLLDPACRWAPDRRSDGAQGTARFV